jgi:hypothetical protein
VLYHPLMSSHRGTSGKATARHDPQICHACSLAKNGHLILKYFIIY